MKAQLIAKLQKFVASDKTALVAAAVQVAVLVGGKWGLHLDTTQEAVIGAGASAGLSYFVHLHFN